MAIQSAVSYVISEEQDGFVAVDFRLIDGHDDDIRDWEIVGDDDDSSVGENSDGVDEISVEDLKSLPEYSPEMFASYRQSIDCVPAGEVDDEDEDEADNLCENEKYLNELFSSEESEPVPEMILLDPVPEMILLDPVPDMIVETLIGRQRQVDYEVSLIRSHRDYDYDYDYERQEEEEEVDYDLDDELVPYSAKVKLGRERMRKLGKRSCSKLVKSKRLTYNYNKAGCVRGKHGLGLKHSLI